MKKSFCLHIVFFLIFCSTIISCKKTSTPEPIDCYSVQTKLDTAVLLVLGQSNAANFGETRYTTYCNQAINFYQGNYYPLADPLKGADGSGGSVWSRLGTLLLQERFAHIVIIAPASIGGTSLQQWKPGGMYNSQIIETITSLQSKGLKITHVLWHQGESDNTVLNRLQSAAENAQQYRTDFLELVTQLRSLGVDAPVFPAITTRCGDMLPDADLQQAQLGLANDSLGIYNGPYTDLLGDEYRYDGCHFNDEGLNVHALLWASILLTH